jgi:hypothetical protein
VSYAPGKELTRPFDLNNGPFAKKGQVQHNPLRQRSQIGPGGAEAFCKASGGSRWK